MIFAGNTGSITDSIAAINTYKKQSRIISPVEIGIIPTSNQPANDSVLLVSSSASDTQIITIWGIDNADVVQVKQYILTGVTPVVSTLAVNNWKKIYGAYLGDSTGVISKRAIGNILIQKQTGPATIDTIAIGKVSCGMQKFAIVGKNVSIQLLSGNVWVDLLNSEALTLDNGFKCSSGSVIECNLVTGITLVSDAATGTGQILVWEG